MFNIKHLVLLFLIALMSLSLVQYDSISTNKKFTRDIQEISEHTQRISQFNLILKYLVDGETGARGYIITGDEKYLEPYDVAEYRLPIELKKLYVFMSPHEQEMLQEKINTRLEQALKLIKKKMNNQQVGALDLVEGKKRMDDARATIANFIQKEEDFLNKKNNEINQVSDSVSRRQVGGSLFSILLVVMSAGFVILEFRKRSEAEEKLQLSLATSEAISREIDFGIIALDSSGNILFKNKWIEHRAKKTINSIQDFFDGNALADVPLKMLLDGRINIIEDLHLYDSNETYVVKASEFGIDEKTKGLLVSVQDTTATTQKMQSLVEDKQVAIIASRAKTDFLAKMSHEIRTPLNAILGVGEILSMSNLSPEQEKCLEIFQRSAQTLNNLVNDILDISKIEAGKIDLARAPFSIKNLVDSCISIMDYRASQKGLLFTNSIYCEIDHYFGDEGRVRQILLNLLGNAIKFTDKGSVTLIVECKEHSYKRREVVFTVVDTGPGIARENIEKLFKNYQQENNQISNKYGGTGLGLALSRELALAMGGDIIVESELGKGSKFIFSSVFDVAAGEFVEEKVSASLQLKKIKILVVDDNPENRFIVKKYLNESDIEIVEAIDGEDAVEKSNLRKFDIIFMDINMPKKDGIEATKEIRANELAENRSRTVIIALSANALGLEHDKARQAGCDDYLTKPISRVRLFKMISKWTTDNEEKMEEEESDIDEDIKEMIPLYLENRKKDIVVLRKALGEKDLKTIARLAHNIKGTALSYGQKQLDVVSKDLDQACKDGDWHQIETSISAMEDLLRE